MSSSIEDLEKIGTALVATLNRHGHAFQAGVLSACNGKHSWYLKAAEFPVQLGGKDFHVDGVLEYGQLSNPNLLILAAIECKRADPKLGHWCFARTVGMTPQVGFEVFVCRNESRGRALLSTGQRLLKGASKAASVGIEIKTGTTGDDTGKALDDAVTQVIRGASGIAQALPTLGTRDEVNVIIVPIVVTTAKLYFTETPLQSADLLTGRLDTLAVREVPWLWYQLHASRSLLPDNVERLGSPQPYSVDSLTHYLSRFHARAVAIVNVAHLDDALTDIPMDC